MTWLLWFNVLLPLEDSLGVSFPYNGLLTPTLVLSIFGTCLIVAISRRAARNHRNAPATGFPLQYQSTESNTLPVLSKAST